MQQYTLLICRRVIHRLKETEPAWETHSICGPEGKGNEKNLGCGDFQARKEGASILSPVPMCLGHRLPGERRVQRGPSSSGTVTSEVALLGKNKRDGSLGPVAVPSGRSVL